MNSHSARLSIIHCAASVETHGFCRYGCFQVVQVCARYPQNASDEKTFATLNPPSNSCHKKTSQLKWSKPQKCHGVGCNRKHIFRDHWVRTSPRKAHAPRSRSSRFWGKRFVESNGGDEPCSHGDCYCPCLIWVHHIRREMVWIHTCGVCAA